jgi:hypothetical protein
MWRREVDLQVGDRIQIGAQCIEVVETVDGEVTLKICAVDDLEGLSDWSIPVPK